jgi:Bacterial Ig-like domain
VLHQPTGRHALTLNNSSFTVSISGGNPITGSIVVAQNGLSATFVPGAPLSPGATYAVRVNGATDLGGQTITTFQSTFATSP